MQGRRRGDRTVLVLVVFALVTVACGTRRSASDFAELQQEGFRPDLINDPSAGSPGGGSTGGDTSGGGTDLGSIGSGGSTAGETPAGPGQSTTGGSTTSGTATAGGDTTSGGATTTSGTGDGDPGGAAGGDTGGEGNTASDVGVTPTSIKVGFITSINGPLGPNVFSPPVQGAQAYFQLLNARGGVNGRTIEMVPPCDDKEDPGQNRQCVERLVNQEQVFALVATSTRAYAGAQQVSDAGVPDVGGQPIGSEMYTYPTMFTIRGSEYAQDGTVGQDGRMWGGGLQMRWFHDQLDLETVGVLFYEIPESRSFAVHIADQLRAHGMDAREYPVNAALPNWDSAVANMQADGIQALWDTLDLTGNQNLCRAMERQGLQLEAKISTVQGWTRRAQSYSQVCRDVLYAISESRPNSDTSHAAVAEFRETMAKVYGEDYEQSLHQWHLEGWAAAMLFTDAVRSLGAEVTREGVMGFLREMKAYEGEGLLSPIEFTPVTFEEDSRHRECLHVARWSDDISNFVPASAFPLCVEDSLFRSYEPAT